MIIHIATYYHYPEHDTIKFEYYYNKISREFFSIGLDEQRKNTCRTLLKCKQLSLIKNYFKDNNFKRSRLKIHYDLNPLKAERFSVLKDS